MPFCITNTPSLVNQVFYEYFDKFIVIYLDDILVYNTTMEKHQVNLPLVFEKLKRKKLYMKRKKCSFAQKHINFLWYIIELGWIDMKVNWKVKSLVIEVFSFHVLVNYYWWLVEEFSKGVGPRLNYWRKITSGVEL